MLNSPLVSELPDDLLINLTRRVLLNILNSQLPFTKKKQKKIIIMEQNEQKDWTKVLYEVILKILTLGFYHIEKHRNDK